MMITFKKFGFPLRLMLSLSTLLLCGLLTAGCITLYLQGGFSRDNVWRSLQGLAWAFWLWLALLVLSLVYQCFFPKKPSLPSAILPQAPVKTGKMRGRRLLRVLLLGLTALFLILGAMNGGMRDVLVKAVNLCMECVGLG